MSHEIRTPINGITGMTDLVLDTDLDDDQRGCLTTVKTDAVISDLVMPDMNGMEFYRRAQEIERFNDEGTVPPPPFIMLTSFEKTSASSDLATDYREAQRQFSTVLHKPVEAEELLLALQHIEYQMTKTGRDATRLRNLLNQCIEQTAHVRGRSGIDNAIDQLQIQLTELRANSQPDDATDNGGESSTEEEGEPASDKDVESEEENAEKENAAQSADSVAEESHQTEEVAETNDTVEANETVEEEQQAEPVASE